MRDRIFSDFIVKKHMDSKLSDEALDAIQNGEMSGMLKCFYGITEPQKHLQFECVTKVMEKTLKIVSLEDIVKSNEFVTQDFIMYEIKGCEDGFIGFSGSRAAMRLLALDYVEKEQDFLNEEQQITPNEVIEDISAVVNAIFDKFSNDYEQDFGGKLELSDRIVGTNAAVSDSGGFYVLTFKILGREVNMILGFMSRMELTFDGDDNNE